jgi:WD40 repeat protein
MCAVPTDGSTTIWDLVNGCVLYVLDGPSIDVPREGYGAVELWRGAREELLYRLDEHCIWIAPFVVGIPMPRLLSYDASGVLRLSDLETGSVLAELAGVRAGHAERSKLSLVLVSMEGTVVCCDVLLESFSTFETGGIFSCLVGNILVTIGSQVTAWDVASGAKLNVFDHHLGIVVDITESVLVARSEKNSSAVWPRRRGLTKIELGKYLGRKGSHIVGVTNDNEVSIYEIETGKPVGTFESSLESVDSLSWSPSGEHLVLSSQSGAGEIWNIQGGLLLRRVNLTAAAWSADSRRLFTGTLDGRVLLWEVYGETVKKVVELYSAYSPLRGLIVTEDGYVDGPLQALEQVRFVDGWALYDLSDMPERHDPERVRQALRPTNQPEGSPDRTTIQGA